MSQERLGSEKQRDLGKRKNLLGKKLKNKTKKDLTNADVMKYVKELMANDLNLRD